MTGFVQIIEYRTSKPEEITALMEDFRAKREAEGGSPAPIRGMMAADRDEPGHYYSIIEFNSYDEAMENSNRSDTTEFAEKMAALCDGPGKFYNLDLMQVAEYH